MMKRTTRASVKKRAQEEEESKELDKPATKMKRKMSKENKTDIPEPKSKRPKVGQSFTQKETKKTIQKGPNIFLQDPILRVLLRHIESVAELKKLRGICQVWSRMCISEIEERAFKGSCKPIDFLWSRTKKLDIKKDAQKDLTKFLTETKDIQRVFRSFFVNFPQSLVVLNQNRYRPFFSNYSPCFIELAIPTDFRQFNNETKNLLINFLNWMAPKLKEIKIANITKQFKIGKLPTSSLIERAAFPKLTKVTLNTPYQMTNIVFGIFKLAFANREGEINTAPNLSILEFESLPKEGLGDLLGIDIGPGPARWTSLTHLIIKKSEHNDPGLLKLSSCLLLMGQNGMKLKTLGLELGIIGENWAAGEKTPSPNLPEICKNMSVFFETQSQSLEALSLDISYDSQVTLPLEPNNEELIKIRFPIFENVTKLRIDLFGEVSINGGDDEVDIIQLENVPKNFPKLSKLIIPSDWDSLNMFYGQIVEPEDRLKLDYLQIGFSRDWMTEDKMDLIYNISSVDTFVCSSSYIIEGGDEIRWEDSLRVLHITNVDLELNLGHLKCLKELIIEEKNYERKPREIKPGYYKRYLGFFKNVAELELDLIKFRGFKMDDWIKFEFIKAFPFPVEIIEEPVGWQSKFDILDL